MKAVSAKETDMIFPVGYERKSLHICMPTEQVAPRSSENLLEWNDHPQALFHIPKCQEHSKSHSALLAHHMATISRERLQEMWRKLSPPQLGNVHSLVGMENGVDEVLFY